MWVKSGCTWLPRALCGSSVPSNLAHCQAAGPGGGVIPKGTLKKSCRSLNCICLYHFGREVGGNSREQFFKEKSHSWIGLPEKHLFFFFFWSALSISGIASLCQEAGSQAELSTYVWGSWEPGGMVGRGVVLKCPCPSVNVWAAENSDTEVESQKKA